MDVIKIAEGLQEQMVRDRRALHRIPEFGFELPLTSEYVKNRLREMGIEPKDCGVLDEATAERFASAGFPKQSRATGVTATIGQGEPCILLRADMDALPMPETLETDYKSQHEGLMHSCGHDGHTAMLLGAAKILKDREKELKGTVKLCFQIGEEWGYGSKLMIDDGLLENPKVDAAFALHVAPDENVGEIKYTEGVTSSSFDTYNMTIQGQGGHSSMPQKCVDPIFIANQLYNALNLLPGREVDPAANVSFVVGAVNAGTAANIIPDTAGMKFGMRTYDVEARNHLKQRIPQLMDGIVNMWRGSYEVVEFNTPSTFNNRELVLEVLPFVKEVVGEENVREFAGVPASEDFGHISEKVPGAYMMIGAGKPGNYPVHNPNMVLDESVFPLGAALHAHVAMEWLKKQHK